jgi:hypothetical protein
MQDLWNYCPHCGEKLQAPAHAMQNPAPAANGPARKRVRRPRSDRGKPRSRRSFNEHPDSGLGGPEAPVS